MLITRQLGRLKRGRERLEGYECERREERFRMERRREKEDSCSGSVENTEEETEPVCPTNSLVSKKKKRKTRMKNPSSLTLKVKLIM